MKTNSETPLTEREYFLFFSLIIGFALFCHLLTIFLPGGISESEETYIYFLFFGVCPVLTYFAYQSVITQLVFVKQRLFFINGYLALFFILICITSILSFNKIDLKIIYFYSFLQVLLTYGVIVLANFLQPNLKGNEFFNIANKWFVKLFPFALLVLFLSPYQLSIINATFHSSSFQTGLILGAVFLVLVFVFPKLSKHHNPTIRSTLKTFSIILLILLFVLQPLLFLEKYDVNNSKLVQEPLFSFESISLWFEVHHLPIIGPAYALLNGKMPLVDSFSQYGFFNIIPYTLAFKYLFVPSVLSATIVTIFLNIIQNITFILILYKVISNKFLVYFGCAMVFILRLVAYSGGQVYAPSHYAGRYLPAMLLLLAIAYLPRLKLFNGWTLLAGLLCSLWSLESFVHGLAIYLVYVVGVSLVQHESLKNTTKNILFVFVMFLSGHIIYSLSVFWIYGSLPRYDIYLDMITAHTNGDWSFSIHENFLMWLFFVVPYFITLVYFWKLLTVQKKQLVLVKYILPTATFGIIAFLYYVKRSFTIDLLVLLFPIAIVLLVSANQLLFRKKFQTFYSLPSFMTILGLGFMLITAYSFKNFPVQSDIVRNMAPIYSCVTTGDKCQNVYLSLKKVFRKAVYGPPLSEELSHQDIEAYKMIQKWQPTEREIIFLWTYNKTEQVLMLAQKFHKFNISSSLNDFFSPNLMKKIINTISVEKGDIIIKHKNNVRFDNIFEISTRMSHSISPLGSTLFEVIKEKWKLSLVDQTKTVEVYKIEGLKKIIYTR